MLKCFTPASRMPTTNASTTFCCRRPASRPALCSKFQAPWFPRPAPAFYLFAFAVAAGNQSKLSQVNWSHFQTSEAQMLSIFLNFCVFRAARKKIQSIASLQPLLPNAALATCVCMMASQFVAKPYIFARPQTSWKPNGHMKLFQELLTVKASGDQHVTFAPRMKMAHRQLIYSLGQYFWLWKACMQPAQYLYPQVLCQICVSGPRQQQLASSVHARGTRAQLQELRQNVTTAMFTLPGFGSCE